MGIKHTLDRETWPTLSAWLADHDPDVILPFPPPPSGGVVGRTVDWFKFQAYCSIRDG